MPQRLATLLLILTVGLAGCRGCSSDSEGRVVVFAAASLARAFSELERQLASGTPPLAVQLEITGSQVAARKVAELNRLADVVAAADHRVIDQILRPEHADHTIRFASNEIVIAHMEHSRFTDQITRANWRELLVRPSVRLGRVDADLAPIGYRTELVWRLADRGGEALAGKLARRCAAEHVVPHEAELLRLLQTRAIDYAFLYRSTAEDHNLKRLRLAPTINLGDARRAEQYARATVAVRMARGKGRVQLRGGPVVYGLAIPKTAPNRAAAKRFVRELLGPRGRAALQRVGFSPLTPPEADPPSALEGLITR